MLGLSEARMDFVLESYALDNPEKMKFTRGSDSQESENLLSTMAQWASKLTGKAKASLVGKMSLPIPEQYKEPKPPQKFQPPKQR